MKIHVIHQNIEILKFSVPPNPNIRYISQKKDKFLCEYHVFINFHKNIDHMGFCVSDVCLYVYLEVIVIEKSYNTRKHS